MKRYITSVRYSDTLGADVADNHLTVFEPDDEPRPTGLLDAHGNEYFSIRERHPIGFVTLREK